jgi:hypothetical protein
MNHPVETISIYLCGYIGGPQVLDKCKQWRLDIIKHYNNYKGQRYPIIWLDPINGRDAGITDEHGLQSNVPPHAIIHRDYQCVRRSDLLIINTDTFGEKRPLIGSIFEIAWAWEHHIPIIMITDDSIFVNHPFTNYVVSHRVSSVEELLEKKVINYYFKGWNDAIYYEERKK